MNPECAADRLYDCKYCYIGFELSDHVGHEDDVHMTHVTCYFNIIVL